MRHNIQIVEEGASDSFIDSVETHIQRIESTYIGKRLIDKIAQSAYIVFIKQSSDTIACLEASRPDHHGSSLGCDSIILYNDGDDGNYLTMDGTSAVHPPFIKLAHELIHCYHNAYGKSARTHRCDRLIWSNDEEYHTIVGFPSKNPLRKTPKITENALLKEVGLPERWSHYTPEFLSKNLFIFERVKLVADIYKRADLVYKKEEGVDRKAPPQIMHPTVEDLESSKQIVLVYHYITSGALPLINPPIIIRMREYPLPLSYVRYEIDPDKCPPILQLHNVSPQIYELITKDQVVKIEAVGLYRMSLKEMELLPRK